MQWNDHSWYNGRHAIFPASQYHWLNYSDDKLIQTYENMKVRERGTVLHEFAATCIRLGQKLPRSTKTLNRYVKAYYPIISRKEFTLHMTIYQWLCLLGVPTMIIAVTKYLLRKIQNNQEDTQAVKLGIQALLRSQMIADYNHYSALEYAPIYAKENFENCWKQYHALGVNGVMDDLHVKFLVLPTAPPHD